ncbi:aldose epimerase family protein [Pedobacter alpinus]|uniref:Aldose 1-epimerase n=1 Tax=Pedobacter alpinus TaxID=1590643 RepID=A0ABW5TSZ2_9SPHI
MMKSLHVYLACLCAGFLGLASCQNNTKSGDGTDSLKIDSSLFDTVIAEKKVSAYELENANHVVAKFTNYGAKITSLMVPSSNGEMTDVVVGFNSIKDFIASTDPYYGAIIGRYANRIGKGKYSIDGVDYQAPTNDGPNMLHGGPDGYQSIVWDAEKLNDTTLQFSHLAKDGEMGFPGNLTVKVIYQLTSKNALKISYEAITDKKTILNLTNHAYFNLNGEGSGTILNHQVQIFANEFTPVDSNLIPTGEIVKVAGTPFDFNNMLTIGERIEADDQQLKYGKGYDHNYVLSDKGEMKHAAKVIGDKTGIIMDVYTEEPGIQFYSGNFMSGKNTFKNGVKDDFRTAFCLETQHFPDSPNHPNFPSTTLSPGETFKSVSYFQFSVKK